MRSHRLCTSKVFIQDNNSDVTIDRSSTKRRDARSSTKLELV